jgi:hypothetical protein
VKLISQYWRGVLRRMQAEVEDFNSIIGHLGEMGRENELSLTRMLENLVPSRYGIGSGLIFDADGKNSRQTDIVIYDAVDEPTIMAQTSQVLFPVENVLGAIEVKTTLTGHEIANIGKKVESVKSLTPRVGESPICAAVGFKVAQSLDTTASHLLELKTDAADNRPDLFLVVDPGMIGLSRRIAEGLGWELPDSVDYLLGVTPLQRQTDGDVEVGAYEPVSASAGTTAIIQGSVFKIYSLGQQYYFAESARALLLFSEALLTTLATDGGRPAPGFHHYITKEMRDILRVQSGEEVGQA